MDKVVEKLVALGVPGLVLLVAMSVSGLAGAAAITAALAALGGPFGMLGGVAMLGIAALVSDALARHGLAKVGAAVVEGYVERGTSREEIWEKVRGYPITKSYKKKIHELLWPDRPSPNL